MPEVQIFTYSGCDTCRKAVRFLREHQIDFTEFPIRETPPSMPDLRDALATADGNIRKLFNTAGRDYRELGLGKKLETLSVDEALELLTRNGNLIKRPFIIGLGPTSVGFNPDTWTQNLPS